MTVDLNTLLKPTDLLTVPVEGPPDAVPQVRIVARPDLAGAIDLRPHQQPLRRDQDEAMRLFHDLVPGTGDGVDFRPPINLDYGIGSTGHRTSSTRIS